MPRPREFDERQVLACAVAQFRRRGYHATSTRDLGAELGLNPSSLYRTFGDKHGLFLRALDHYQESENERTSAVLEADADVRVALRAWLLALTAGSDEAEPALGCLVVNAATELGTGDRDACHRIRAAMSATRAGVAAALRRAVSSGELSTELDTDAAAEMLFTTRLGLLVRQSAGEDPDRLRIVADGAIRALG